MKAKSLFLAATAAFLATSALADDAVLSRIDKAFYVDISGGPAVMFLNLKGTGFSGTVANTYWGAQGNVGVCASGVGQDWLDLCGGVTGFTTLGGVAQQVTGGSTKTSISTYGAYAQAKANVGNFTIGPLAGYRRLEGNVVTLNGGGTTIGTTKVSSDSYFAGLESSFKFLQGRGEIGSRAEYGRTIKNSTIAAFDYGTVSAFVRVKF